MGRAQVSDLEVETRLDLPVGLLGQADRAGLGDAFELRGDVDPVAHQIAVALLDHVAEVNAHAKLDASVRWRAGVALNHCALDFDRAAHGVDHAAKFDDEAVARSLDDSAVMDGDCRIDEIAAQRPEPCQRPIFVRAREAAEVDDVAGQDRGELAILVHGGPQAAVSLAQCIFRALSALGGLRANGAFAWWRCWATRMEAQGPGPVERLSALQCPHPVAPQPVRKDGRLRRPMAGPPLPGERERRYVGAFKT